MSSSDHRGSHELAPMPTPHNLPASLNRLIGRDAEASQAFALLSDPSCRLLNMTGVGGVGKTRLAQEIARTLAYTDPPLFPNGVFFVPLGALPDSGPSEELLATAISNALGITFSGRTQLTEQLHNYLSSKRMLLLLDAIEHLTEHVSRIEELLHHAPELKLLATSRERLNLPGEWLIRLDGLPLPPRPPIGEAHNLAHPSEVPSGTQQEHPHSVELFVQVARSYSPHFEPNSDTLPAIHQICHLVAGLPLGIELAASWTRLLSCQEIAQEIAKSIDFLADHSPNLPSRQRSMRAVLTHSWNMLSASEQQGLRQLSVFHGSFTREAATAVLQLDDSNGPHALLYLLAALVDKSLLQRHEADAEGHARYELLDMLRQFAAEQLEAAGEREATAARHAAYYGRQLSALTPDLRGTGQMRALNIIISEIAQIRAAWQYAISSQDIHTISIALEGLFHFYDMRSWFHEGALAFSEARNMLEQQPESPEQQLVLGKLLAREGWFIFHEGQQLQARALLERSQELLTKLNARADLIFTLNYLGAVCAYLGEIQRTQSLCQSALTLAQSLDDLHGQAVACNILGQAAYEYGNYAAAQTWSQQSLAIEQQIDNQWSMSFSLTNLGKVAYAMGAYAKARWFFEESLRTRQAMNDTRGMAICLNRLGDTAAAQDQLAQAWEYYEAGLELFYTIGNQWGMAASLMNLGQLALRQKEETSAVSLFQEALQYTLQTRALPQIVSILQTLTPLLRMSGETAWADQISLLLGQKPSFEACQPHVRRLLSWSLGPLKRAQLEMEETNNILASSKAKRLEADTLVLNAPAPRKTGGSRDSSENPAGLTSREMEVLRLVAEGLTDAQVAERLVLSPRTVQTHLSSIYSKLHVNTRSAATRFAVEHGLV